MPAMQCGLQQTMRVLAAASLLGCRPQELLLRSLVTPSGKECSQMLLTALMLPVIDLWHNQGSALIEQN